MRTRGISPSLLSSPPPPRDKEACIARGVCRATGHLLGPEERLRWGSGQTDQQIGVFTDVNLIAGLGRPLSLVPASPPHCCPSLLSDFHRISMGSDD